MKSIISCSFSLFLFFSTTYCQSPDWLWAKQIISKEELIEHMQDHVKNLNKEFGGVIITAGAGDIDAFVQPLKKIIQTA